EKLIAVAHAPEAPRPEPAKSCPSQGRTSCRSAGFTRSDTPPDLRADFRSSRSAAGAGMTRTAVSVRLIAGAPVALVDHARAERPGLDQVEPKVFGDRRQEGRA